MLEPFSAQIGPYAILLPANATMECHAEHPSLPEGYRWPTRWVVRLGRYQLFVHLTVADNPAGLKDLIDYQTRSDVTLKAITINGIPGVTHGDYGPPRTWIDWWFKEGDTMICMCLQSVGVPVAKPTAREQEEHLALIKSLTFIPANR